MSSTSGGGAFLSLSGLEEGCGVHPDGLSILPYCSRHAGLRIAANSDAGGSPESPVDHRALAEKLLDILRRA
jgi:hypothetical protein